MTTIDEIKAFSKFNCLEDYKIFLQNYMGTELIIGNNFIRLWDLEEIIDFNSSYEITNNFEYTLGIGTNGGGEFIAMEYANDDQTRIVLSPFIDLDKQYHIEIGKSFTDSCFDWKMQNLGLNSIQITLNLSTMMIAPPNDATLLPDASRVWTYEDVKDWGEDVHCEILNGELYMNSSKTFKHQLITGNIMYIMHGFVKNNKLGKIYPGPMDIRLTSFNLLVPDVIFISNENKEISYDHTIIGPPDLVVEVVSPSSIRRDYHDKLKIYENFKVTEYWIIDPANKSVEVFVLKNNAYEIFTFGTESEHIAKSIVLPELEITLADIFKE